MAERKSSSPRTKKSGSSSGSSSRAKSKTTKTSAGKPAATKGSGSRASKRKPPAPNMQERMEGLQGWMAEIERRQSRMTRFGGAAVLLAVLAAGGAIALGVINQQNAATEDDIDELTEKVNELGSSLEQQTEKQIKGANDRLGTLEQRLTAIEQKQAQIATQVQTLQSQPARGGGAGAGAGAVQPDAPGGQP